MLTSTVLLSSILPVVLSSPVIPRQASSYPPITFGVIAARSASPVHLQSVNANGLALWIGKETATYCPLTNTTECPPGDETVFAVGGGGASLVRILSFTVNLGGA